MDTPGLNGLQNDHKEAIKRLTRCILATSPGFNCIVWVISAAQRVEDADLQLFREIEKLLGNNAFNYMVVVFTHVEPTDLAEVLGDKKDAPINIFCTKCHDRYLSFGDKTNPILEQQQVDKFFKTLHELIEINSKQEIPFYNHKLYEVAANFLRSDAELVSKKYPYKIDLAKAVNLARYEALDGLSPNDGRMMLLVKDSICITTILRLLCFFGCSIL